MALVATDMADQATSEGGDEGGIVVNTFPVEVSEPQEGLNLLHRLGGRLDEDSRDFCRVHADARFRD